MAINLTKGQKIDLTKKSSSGSTSTLTKFCVGVNWGAIEKMVTRDVRKGGFLGMGGTKERVTSKVMEAVDLDASCSMYSANNELLDVVYFGQLKSKDGSVFHSGDDLEGDLDGDDGLDNEVISVDLTRVDPRIDQIVFFLNSYKKQDFATVPFAAIRLYEGTPERVNTVFAKYDVASDNSYRGHVTMIMGKLYRRNNEWKFSAIGDPTRDADIKQTLQTIGQKYL